MHRVLDLFRMENVVDAIVETEHGFTMFPFGIFDQQTFDNIHLSLFGDNFRAVMHDGYSVGRVFRAWTDGCRVWVSAVFFDSSKAEDFLNALEDDD